MTVHTPSHEHVVRSDWAVTLSGIVLTAASSAAFLFVLTRVYAVIAG
jgi:hypothetical protein